MVRGAPGWVETEASVHLVERIAKANGTDYAAAENSLTEPRGLGRRRLAPPHQMFVPLDLAQRVNFGRGHRETQPLEQAQ